jgi:hypothetical protein
MEKKMFAINHEAKVVWAETGAVVSYDETKQFSQEQANRYGRLCVEALDKDYEPEKVKLP